MDDMLEVLQRLSQIYEIEVFLTHYVNTMDTRFYQNNELKDKIKAIIHKDIHTTIQEAERFGPFEKLDIVCVYPCDANTLAKLVHGINDNAVTMLVKSSLRNDIPIVLGVFSNDILSNSGNNLLTIMNRKNYYLVPMYQDNYKTKPNSMIACKNKIDETLVCALNHQQYQPFILGYREV